LRLSSVPFPDDYVGGITDKTARGLLVSKGGDYKPDGDHRKAARVIFEMAVGQGVGKGKEHEKVMALGRDMCLLMDRVVADINHQIETFREIGSNVYIEK
jgi:hypothetical protein